MNLIQQLEHEQVSALVATRPVPNFQPGDTVRVNVRIKEVEDKKADKKGKAADKNKKPEAKFRVQAYEGLCIARAGGSLNANFTVRKISYGEGVERVFPLYSPMIDSIEVVRRGEVRRAKLYYLRGLRGKAARIFERTDVRGKKLAQLDNWKGFKKPKGETDNLTMISGIGVELALRLNKLGVTKYEQIANFSDDEMDKLDLALNLEGRIGRDDWTTKARNLFAEQTAHEVPAEAATETPPA